MEASYKFGISKLQFILAIIFLALQPVTASAIEVGAKVPAIYLSETNGGRVDGTAWSSDEIKGKIFSVFYVDPSKKELNEPLEQAYKGQNFPPDKHGSVAIINMAAAWYPNSVIESKLKEKQKQFPRTTYVKDMHKNLVSSWGLEDKSVNLVVFDRDGRVLWTKNGALTSDEIVEVMALIRKNL